CITEFVESERVLELVALVTVKQKSSRCFFFSSRRRHTRSYGDWSSDVCSSDLLLVAVRIRDREYGQRPATRGRLCGLRGSAGDRSEERRVGKEWGFGGTVEKSNENIMNIPLAGKIKIVHQSQEKITRATVTLDE